MLRTTILSIIAIISIGVAEAQYAVKGVVCDSIGEGEGFATLRVYAAADTLKPVAVDVADAEGIFNVTLKQPGEYRLNINSVGREPLNKDFTVGKSRPVADVGSLVVRNQSTMLSELQVVAQKPLVKAEIDRVSYDIKADEDAKTSTIFEMLRKVPLVTIDGDENILVNGSSDFKIYKNGRPNTAFNRSPKDVFKTIPASAIKRIEVITEPGAKYDAEGVNGILNIVMDDEAQLNGVSGTATLGYTLPSALRSGISLATQVKKFTFSLNYVNYFILDKNGYKGMQQSRREYDDTGNVYSSGGEEVPKGHINFINLDASFELDTLNLFTLSGGGYFYRFRGDSFRHEQLAAPDGTTLYSFNRNVVDALNKYFNFTGEFNYQHRTHRKDESVNFSYQLSASNDKQDGTITYTDLVNPPMPYTTIDRNMKGTMWEHTFQLDWTRPFAGGHKLETGAKYIFRDNASKSRTLYDGGYPDEYRDFSHLTHVAAVYGEYSYNTERWGARAGLRYEFSRFGARYHDGLDKDFNRSLNDLVPTLSANWRITDAHSLRFNFATRINRPGIDYLNPARREEPTSVSYGNPDLVSARNHSMSLTYMYISPKLTINASTGFNFSNTRISPLIYVIDDVLYSTYANTGKFRDWYLNLYGQWSPWTTTNLSMSAGVYYNSYLNDDKTVSNSRPGGYWNMNFRQHLPWKLRLSGWVGWWAGGCNSLYSYSGHMWYYGLALERSFLKEDRLTVKLDAQNPFSSRYNSWTSHGVNAGYTSLDKNSWTHRRFGITVSFRFGSLNAQVKKADKSISNDDVVGAGKREPSSQGGQN